MRSDKHRQCTAAAVVANIIYNNCQRLVVIYVTRQVMVDPRRVFELGIHHVSRGETTVWLVDLLTDLINQLIISRPLETISGIRFCPDRK